MSSWWAANPEAAGFSGISPSTLSKSDLGSRATDASVTQEEIEEMAAGVTQNKRGLGEGTEKHTSKHVHTQTVSEMGDIKNRTL